MNDKPTNLPAWAGTKPPPLPRLSSSDVARELAEVAAALQPIDRRSAMAELTACLTLVAPVGMSANDRTEFLAVAARTIGPVAVGPFRAACDTARKLVRWPNELVHKI